MQAWSVHSWDRAAAAAAGGSQQRAGGQTDIMAAGAGWGRGVGGHMGHSSMPRYRQAYIRQLDLAKGKMGAATWGTAP